MTRPTSGQVHALIRQLGQVDLYQFERRLITALDRDATGTTRRDGYPSGRPGAGGDDAGTSTETAALTNIDGARHDVLHEHITSAVDHLWTAAASLDAARRRLDLIDQLAQPAPAYDPSGHCQACTRWVAGTSADRIRSGYCDACRKDWPRWSAREREAGREPDRHRFELARRQRAEAS